MPKYRPTIVEVLLVAAVAGIFLALSSRADAATMTQCAQGGVCPTTAFFDAGTQPPGSTFRTYYDYNETPALTDLCGLVFQSRYDPQLVAPIAVGRVGGVDPNTTPVDCTIVAVPPEPDCLGCTQRISCEFADLENTPVSPPRVSNQNSEIFVDWQVTSIPFVDPVPSSIPAAAFGGPPAEDAGVFRWSGSDCLPWQTFRMPTDILYTVPEPGVGLQLASGVLALVALGRRRR